MYRPTNLIFCNILLVLLVSGGCYNRNMEFIADATDWKIAPHSSISESIRLDFSSKQSVPAELQQYTKDKFIALLNANGFQINDKSQARLTVNIINAVEIIKNVRMVKIRIAICIRSDDTNDSILQGTVDGMTYCEDLNWFLGLPMPVSLYHYQQAADQAVSKCIRQINMINKKEGEKQT